MRHGERGAALLVTVLLVSLLSVMVVEFLREARLEVRAAGNLRDSLEAHALVRSGVAVGSALLLADAEDTPTDHRGEDWATPLPPIPLGDGLLSVTVADLEGRFPLGALVDGNGRAVPSRVDAYRRLLELADPPGADLDTLVDALVDWIDADDDGAYEDNPEYALPNAPLGSVGEMGRIEGYDPGVLAVVVPLVDTRTDKTFNVNTAPVELIYAAHPQMGEDQAQELYDDLTETPLEKASDLRTRPSVSGLTLTQFTLNPAVTSNRFEVHLAADVRGVNRLATAVLVRNPATKKVTLLSWLEE